VNDLLQFIETTFPVLVSHKYFFVYLGTALEGMYSAILAGFLASIGTVSFWPVLWVALAGGFTNGFLWYAVGYFVGSRPIDKWGRKENRVGKIIQRVEQYFCKYGGGAVLLAKMTWSVTTATMIVAGSLKYNWKKFAMYNFVGSVGWAFMFVFFGFFFGHGYGFLVEYIKDLLVFILVLASAVVAGYIIKKTLNLIFVRLIFLGEYFKNISDKIKNSVDNLFPDQDNN